MNPFPQPSAEHQHAHDPEVSSLMTVVRQGAVARTQKTINVTSVVSG